MEELVSKILTLSQTESDLRRLHDQLWRGELEVRTIMQSGSVGNGIFDGIDLLVTNLDLYRQALGIIHICRSQAYILKEMTVGKEQAVLGYCHRLCSWIPKMNGKQLRISAKVSTDLCDILAELATRSTAGLCGQCCIELIYKIEPNTTVLTTAHAAAAQCLLVAKQYTKLATLYEERPGIRIAGMRPVNRLIDEYKRRKTEDRIDAAAALASSHKAALREQSSYIASSGLEPVHLLKWLYYAGIGMAGLKRWQEATDLLRRCVSMPAQQCSAIVIAAAKKMTLCAILAQDYAAATEFPKYCPQPVSRFFRNHACLQAYRALARAVLIDSAFLFDQQQDDHDDLLNDAESDEDDELANGQDETHISSKRTTPDSSTRGNEDCVMTPFLEKVPQDTHNNDNDDDEDNIATDDLPEDARQRIAFLSPEMQKSAENTENEAQQQRISVARALKQGADIFSRDGNAGLVAQATTVYLERKALALRSLYLNLPLTQLADKLRLAGGAPEARSLCEKLALAHPELIFRIDVRSQLVSFGDEIQNKSPEDEAATSRRLLIELKKVNDIGQALALVSDHISAHPIYIAKQNAQKDAPSTPSSLPNNDPASAIIASADDSMMMDEGGLVPLEFA